MKILLTGHKGFIGSNFLKYLNDYSFDTYEWGDEIPKISNYDWVFHIGAISSTTETDVEKVMRQNYDFTCWLIDECIRHDVNLQYSSSASVYGLKTEFTESSPVDPRTPYAWSKYMTEKYCENRKHRNIIQGFRYFNVYGPGEQHKGRMASVAFQMNEKHKNNEEIKLFPRRPKRDFVYIKDVISANIHAFENYESLNSHYYEVGSGVARMFEDVMKIMSIPFEYHDDKLIPNGYQFYTCSNKRKWMKGWESKWSLEDGLKDYFNL